MLDFIKMNGLGNDYIFLNLIENDIDCDFAKLAKLLSNRNFSIGSDGLILIEKSEVADVKMTMYNSDGSSAGMCGNGIRCVSKLVYEQGFVKKETFNIETVSGIKEVHILLNEGQVNQIEVDMGEPIFAPSLIPVRSKQMPVKNLKIDVLDKVFYLDVLSMGNPHAITIVDHLNNFDVTKYGSLLENNSHFPERTNVEFIEIIDRSTIKMRVFERGTGETLACGTGACACVVACYLDNLTNNNVTVKLKGGSLFIRIDEKTNHVWMRGEANISFYGKIDLDRLWG